MHKEASFLIFLLFACLFQGYSQKMNVRPVLGFDPSYTRFFGEQVQFFGIKGGIGFGKAKAGIGYYFLNNQVIERHEGNKRELKFRYLTLFGERDIIKKRKWGISGSLQFGVGQSFYLENDSLKREVIDQVVIIEPGISTYYNFLPWAGIGAGVGFRKSISPGLFRFGKYSSGTVSIGFLLYPFDLYKAFKEGRLFNKKLKDE